MDRQGMVDLIVAVFPQLEGEIRDECHRGLDTLEIACFARYTQDRIDGGDRKEVERCLQLAHRIYMDGDRGVRNAVAVSYLEGLNLEDGRRKRSWAKPLLTQALRQVYLGVTGKPPPDGSV